jgi:hypothetical protein
MGGTFSPAHSARSSLPEEGKTRTGIASLRATNQTKNKREGEATALTILQDTEPSRTQREGEAPAELVTQWLGRSLALPCFVLPGLVLPGLVLPGDKCLDFQCQPADWLRPGPRLGGFWGSSSCNPFSRRRLERNQLAKKPANAKTFVGCVQHFCRSFRIFRKKLQRIFISANEVFACMIDTFCLT